MLSLSICAFPRHFPHLRAKMLASVIFIAEFWKRIINHILDTNRWSYHFTRRTIMWAKVMSATVLPLLTAAVQVWFQSALFHYQFKISSYGNFTQYANLHLAVTRLKSFVFDGPDALVNGNVSRSTWLLILTQKVSISVTC